MCDKRFHKLKEILRAEGTDGVQNVVLWCTECGGVVVDAERNGETAPGGIMKMQMPSEAIVAPEEGTDLERLGVLYKTADIVLQNLQVELDKCRFPDYVSMIGSHRMSTSGSLLVIKEVIRRQKEEATLKKTGGQATLEDKALASVLDRASKLHW